MDVSYGIGVKNRYALLLEEDEDPMEAIARKDDDKTRLKKADKTAITQQNNVKDKTNAIDKSKANTVNNKTVNNAKQNAMNATNNASKAKTNDSSSSQPKPKDNTIKGEPKPPSMAGNRANKDRVYRKSDAHQSGEKTNHLTNSDRSNRPPHPPTSNDQKDIEEYKNQRNREDRISTDMREKRERSDSDRKNRGGRNGGARRGRFSDSRGKRDLDRHSGSDKSGVKAVDKREGGGAFNWGKFDENADEAVNDSHDNAERSADENAFDVSDTNQELDANAPEGETEPKPEEPKEMTLDEWKAQQEEKRMAPKFNLRKPGEGEDNSQWKKTFILKKKEDEEEVEYEEIEVDEELSKKGRQKHLLDIEINFRDDNRDFPSRGGGRRGGRGGGPRGGGGGNVRDRDDREKGDRDRGGRGRDRPFDGRSRGRGNRSKEQTAPKVDDWNEFPSILK